MTDYARLVDEAVAACGELGPRDHLVDRLTLEARQPSAATSGDGSPHRKVSGSPAPWQDPLADHALRVEAGARQHAARLRWLLEHRPHDWAASRAASRKAMADLAVLLPAALAGGHHDDVERIAKEVTAWARKARRLLWEERPDERLWTLPPQARVAGTDGRYAWQRLRDPEGHLLWLAPGWEDRPASARVYCRDGCTHADGSQLSYEAGAWVASLQVTEPALDTTATKPAYLPVRSRAHHPVPHHARPAATLAEAVTVPAPRTCTRCLAPATHGVRCAQHVEPEHRPPASQRGYGSAWRRRRRQYLDAHPLCAIQGMGCTTTATVPDHWPVLRADLVARGDAHPDADHHLRPACEPCHAKYGLRST